MAGADGETTACRPQPAASSQPPPPPITAPAAAPAPAPASHPCLPLCLPLCAPVAVFEPSEDTLPPRPCRNRELGKPFSNASATNTMRERPAGPSASSTPLAKTDVPPRQAPHSMNAPGVPESTASERSACTRAKAAALTMVSLDGASSRGGCEESSEESPEESCGHWISPSTARLSSWRYCCPIRASPPPPPPPRRWCCWSSSSRSNEGETQSRLEKRTTCPSTRSRATCSLDCPSCCCCCCWWSCRSPCPTQEPPPSRGQFAAKGAERKSRRLNSPSSGIPAKSSGCSGCCVARAPLFLPAVVLPSMHCVSR